MPALLNKIIKTLIISDFFLNLGWGLLSPVFALFILENITKNDSLKAAEVAGLAAMFYWISKSFIEIPIGYLLDKKHGEKDDFWFMTIGVFIMTIVPIGYLFSSEPWHIYLFQVVHAVGMAMALPSWLAIFTRHIDKGKEGFEWGVETTSIGLGAGIAGGLGGIICSFWGFTTLFILVAILNFVSGICLLFIRNNVFLKRDGAGVIMDKPNIVP
jgi:predicted MFS family arabinose efflux permease